jgi:hypothetical protein
LDDALTLAGTSVQSLATAAKVGELTRYDLTDPVTLARRGSAMLPIIADVAIKAEKVSIYNQAVMAKYPLNGAYLTNDTKLTLLAGPITVLDGGMYAGDARLDNVTAGEKRLISYAIDLNVAVDPSASSTTALTAAKVVRGVLQLTRKTTFKHEYAIHNKADQPRTMIIEHPFSADRKLIDPKEAEEKTAAVYRFRVPVKAGETGKFPVVEERSDSQTVEILPATPDYLAAFVSGTEIPKAVKDALAKAITLKNELAQLQSRQATLAQQMNVLKTDQARLRENVKTFGADSPNGKTFAKKLMDSETEIEKLDGQVKELTDQIKAKQKELADYLNVLNIE